MAVIYREVVDIVKDPDGQKRSTPKGIDVCQILNFV